MKLNQRLGLLVVIAVLLYMAVPRTSLQTAKPRETLTLSHDGERKLLQALERSNVRLQKMTHMIDEYNHEVQDIKRLASSWHELSGKQDIPNVPAQVAHSLPDNHNAAEVHKKETPTHPTRPPESPAIGDPNGAITLPPFTQSSMKPIPILVIACNRVSVATCLDQLIKYRPNREQFPIIVSQDCMHEETAKVIRGYEDKGVELYQQPNQSDPMPASATKKERKWKGYFQIARHYKFALNTIFNHSKNFDSVIIVEDDLDVSPDFFEYFMAGRQLLRADPTLFCVSAWNDNGKGQHVADPTKLYRTDFFGGLGWMILRGLWDDELASKWTYKYWDDWMRLPDQRKGRSCIRPEIGRTDTFGAKGVSKGQFYKKYLKYIKLNDKIVNFTQMDLSFLLKQNYDQNFLDKVYSSDEISQIQLFDDSYCAGLDKSREYRLEYRDNDQFKRIAKALKIMEDFKEGVPRTAYLGIVSLSYRKNVDSPPEAGVRVHIAPVRPWAGYVGASA